MTHTAISPSHPTQQRSNPSQPKSGWTSDLERLQSFGRALDAIHAETKAKLGRKDTRYIRHVDRVSRVAELVGRTLIAVSPGPMLFTVGVMSLWLYKQLQATEIGHGVLHGAYDKLVDDDDSLHGKAYRQESWPKTIFGALRRIAHLSRPQELHEGLEPTLPTPSLG